MQFTIGVDQGAKGVTGIVLGGRRNSIELGKRGSHERFPKCRALIFAESAEGNQINLVDSELEDPHDIVTDQARTPSNQLTWTGPPLPFRKVENVGREFSHTQRLYPATLRWSGGAVESVTLVRGGQTLDLGRATHQEPARSDCGGTYEQTVPLVFGPDDCGTEKHSVTYRIANNHVHHCGTDYYGAVAILLSKSRDSVVAHNLIHDTAYFGIGVAGS